MIPSSCASHFQTAVERGIDFPGLRSLLNEGVGRLLADPRYGKDGQVWMTGSGDSLFAAQSAIPALRRWSGMRAASLSAMEFARYQVPLLAGSDIVWGISNSGSASRTREAVSLARARQNLTVGLTGTRTGPLANLADVVLYRPVSELPEIDTSIRRVFLNMIEYLAALYALYFVGLRIAVENGAMVSSAAERIASDCEKAILSLGDLARRHEPTSAQLAGELKEMDTIWITGAGPNFGTARYAAAKFHEQLPWNGIPEDLEEWAHLQYFLTLSWGGRSVVFVLAPPGNCLDRAEELVHGIADAGGRAIVVAHPDYGRFPEAWIRFDMPGLDDEFLSPLTYHLPSQLLVLHLAGQAHMDLTPLRRQDDYRLIRGGVVRTDPDVLR